MNWENVAFVAAALFIGVLVLLVLWLLLVVLPVHAVAQKRCLEAGYPKAVVTYDLQRYCTTLDGAVTVKIQKVGG